MVAPIDRSASPWIELMKMLMQGEHETQSNWQHNVSTTQTYQWRVASAQQMEAPHVPRIEMEIDQWLKTGQWPPMSAEEKHHARRRFSVALYFLTHVMVSNETGSTTIFPFPKMSLPQVAKWMLVHWWKDHGHQLDQSLGPPD